MRQGSPLLLVPTCCVPNDAMQEAGQLTADVASAMVHVGLGPHCRASVFGANSPEWMLTMQAS